MNIEQFLGKDLYICLWVIILLTIVVLFDRL